MRQPTEPLRDDRQHLSQIRDALLTLHKALIDSERGRYETAVGAIQSPNHFLQLLTTDPWFAWLQPFSQLIVAIDQVLDEEEVLTAAMANALINQSRSLLVAAENGEGFSGHYDVALQQDPDVILAHAAAIKLIGRSTAPPSP
jgi:hypothetical protein